MKLDTSLFNSIAQQAKESPRLRMHYDLRDSNEENGQRMLNVLLPGTTENIHRHLNTSEVVICIQGKAIETFYDEDGNITETVEMTAGGECPGVLVEINRWHSIKPIGGPATVITTMAGKYDPNTIEIMEKK